MDKYRQTSFSLNRNITSLILFLSIFLCACNPEDGEFKSTPEFEQLRFEPHIYGISQEEFVDKLVGVYNVTEFHFTNHDISFHISFLGDSLKIQNYREDYSRVIYLNDTSLCNINFIESIQFWNIYQKSDTLFLETYDMCGHSEKYIVESSNHSQTTKYLTIGYHVNAEIKIRSANSEEITELKHFEIGIGVYVGYPTLEAIKRIEFYVVELNDVSGSATYRLTSKILNYDCFNLPPTLTE